MTAVKRAYSRLETDGELLIRLKKISPALWAETIDAWAERCGTARKIVWMDA